MPVSGSDRETLVAKKHLRRGIFQVSLDRSQTDFEAGHTLTLTCTVVGFPAPVVKWYKNNTPLPKSDRFSVDADSTLTVKRLTVIDGGVYACRATNVHQSVSESIKVTVKEGEEPPPECEDNPYFARCDLIVRANYCMSIHYGKFCCKTCTEAGLLQPGWEQEVRQRETEKQEAAEEDVASEQSGHEGSSSTENDHEGEPQQSGIMDSVDEVLGGGNSQGSSDAEGEKSVDAKISSSEYDGSAENEIADETEEEEDSGSGGDAKPEESGMETDNGMRSEDGTSGGESGESSVPE